MGLTLVELLIATLLGSILIGVVVFVWIQSNEIFTVTVNRIEAYQRLRTVLDLMERDLANTNRTVDMEFFVDAGDPPNNHYDPGEELLIGPDSFRKPRDNNDLLFGKNEFGPEDATNFSMSDVPYLYGPLLLSPQPYEVTGRDGYLEDRAYWRDEIYVRTFASVAGVNTPALVHYRLVQTGDGRSVLRRRLWYLDENGAIVAPDPVTGLGGTDLASVLSHAILDLKVGFYFKPSPLLGEGFWYDVGTIGGAYGQKPQALVDLDRKRGFRAATDATQPLARQFKDPGQFNGVNGLSFVYEGNARFELPDIGGPVLRTLEEGDLSALTLTAANDLSHYDNFDFPGVRPGDRVYIDEATDDDPQQAGGAPKQSDLYFTPQVLTVETIFSDPTRRFVGVKFREPVNFYRLMSTWLGAEHQPPFEVTAAQVAPTGTYPLAGPARKIVASFNVKYRVGFLPAALVVRLSCDDRKNKKVIPMERVIRLLQQ